MKKLMFIIVCSTLFSCSGKPSLDDFFPGRERVNASAAIFSNYKFNGYTYYWQDVYQHRYRYGNLFRLNIPDINASVLQAKADVGEALHMPGLQVQEGFIKALLKRNPTYRLLDNPSVKELNDAIGQGDVLIYANTGFETGKKLLEKAEGIFQDNQDYNVGHQAKARGCSNIHAFVLKKSGRTLYAVVGTSQEQLARFRTVLENTLGLLSEYDLKRGWFGAQTLIKSVTCTPGTPIDVMGQGLNEGNSWFIFDGYMEFLAKKEIDGWVAESGLPVVADVGFPPVYNCSDYDDLQIQLMFTPQDWIEYAKRKNGYVFRQIDDRQADNLPYNGYYANPGNARQINDEDMPFVIQTGDLLTGATSHMVLFNKKGQPFDKVKLWDAIMGRRAVAIAEGGFMMGAEHYRNALQLLFLDKVYLEDYFGDRVNLETETRGNQILLTVTNTYDHSVTGQLKVNLPQQLSISGEKELTLSLPAGVSKTLAFRIEPTTKAMNRRHAVAFTYDWGGLSAKSTLAMLELPPVISVHELLYGTSSGIQFPVSVHNFTAQDSFAVKINVAGINDPSNRVFEAEKNAAAATGDYCDMEFDLQLPAGNYLVTTSALGLKATTQLGVEASSGFARMEDVDLNGDGISEYVMENQQVKVTLLTTGARVIEYIVKKKNDNVLFKLWPQKPDDDRRTYRERGFYPYGGFEDFLGQPSIETHKVYDATVEKREGEYVRLRMTAEYYGNFIEKLYTLYGNTPLLEVRFAMRMINPELNIIGPQPILEIGKAHGLEDRFIIPEKDGLQEYRMRADRYYGKKLDVIEGWNAGYDTQEDIAFVGAYPVTRPIFLHMWMNHPSNPDTNYFYAEFQPWVPLFMRSTSYFSYYMWAEAGDWQKVLDELKNRNLITIRN
ncbi:hypothetical protein [uncultured Proteiniphilum sp.]|uniref:COG1470 family protein n=1 Tax=uncultured Proteiniphilum sp. TaxID=497637 RepID=UPI0026296BC0|nr:hypothetical protein [uncultured Proteiniphilum sp.]